MKIHKLFHRFQKKIRRLFLSSKTFVFCFIRKIFRFNDFILFIRYFDEQFIWNKKFEKMSINFAKFKTKKFVVQKTINYRHCWLKKDFVLKMKSSRIWLCWRRNRHKLKKSRFFLFVDQLIANVKFISFVTMKIKYNVRRVFKKQILHENQMSKIKMCVKFSLISMWIFVVKIRFFNRKFSNMFVTILIIKFWFTT